MPKESLYFTHDYGARNDPKLINLQIKHGMTGIGVFWCIIEMLFEEGGELPLEYERIAFALRTDTNVIKSVIEDFGLFIIEENMLSSVSVLKRIEIRNEKSLKAKESANHRWDKYRSNANAQNNDANALKNDAIKEINKGNKINKGKTNFDLFFDSLYNDENWHQLVIDTDKRFFSSDDVKTNFKAFYDWRRVTGDYNPQSETDVKKYFANWCKTAQIKTTVLRLDYSYPIKKPATNG